MKNLIQNVIQWYKIKLNRKTNKTDYSNVDQFSNCSNDLLYVIM